MNIMQRNKTRGVALTIAVVAMLAVLVGCERDEPTTDSRDSQASVDQPATDRSARDEPDRDDSARSERDADQQPMEHVSEFDGFTLRANVSRTDVLPDAMARRYDIEPDSDLVLLNVVILEDQGDQQSAPVSADVSAYFETLSGHAEAIDMRAAEADSHVSYIGTLDASDQRTFKIHIEARPADADQPLHMNFEVELEAFEMGDSENR